MEGVTHHNTISIQIIEYFKIIWYLIGSCDQKIVFREFQTSLNCWYSIEVFSGGSKDLFEMKYWLDVNKIELNPDPRDERYERIVKVCDKFYCVDVCPNKSVNNSSDYPE